MALGRLGQPAELDLVDLRQLLPLLVLAIERLENVGDLDLQRAAHEHALERRARLGVVGVGGQNVPIGGDRLRHVGEGQLVDLRQTERQLDDLGLGRGDADLAPHHVGQLLPALAAGVEPVERHQRRAVLGLRFDDRLVRDDRVVDLAGLLLQDAREPQQQVGLALRILGAIQLGRVETGQLLPAVGLGGQPLQVGQDIQVGRLDVQRSPVRLERRALVRQPALLDLGDLDQTLDRLPRILGVRRHDLVDGNHAVPLAQRLVDGLQHLGGQHRLRGPRHQRLERVQRRSVAGIHRQHAPIGLDRVRQVVQVLAPQLADAEPQADDLFLQDGRLSGETSAWRARAISVWRSRIESRSYHRPACTNSRSSACAAS